MMVQRKKEDYCNEDDCVRWYYAIKTHFSNMKYNAVSNEYMVKGIRNRKSYTQDKKFAFLLRKKFTRDENYRMFLVVCFMNDMINISDAYHNWHFYKNRYAEKKKIMNNIDKYFKDDLLFIRREYHELNKVLDTENNGESPIILNLVIQRKITIETYVILHTLFNVSSYIDEKYPASLLWDRYKKKIKKYSCFFSYIDKSFYQETVKNIFKPVK